MQTTWLCLGSSFRRALVGTEVSLLCMIRLRKQFSHLVRLPYFSVEHSFDMQLLAESADY